MYTLVRRYVKTALVFFLLGLALGFWILFLQFWGSPGALGYLITAHTHLILFGFVIMLIMGVAYWMFPRPAKDDYRYSPNLAEVNYWLITLGTSIRAGGEVYMYIIGERYATYAVAAGSTLQLLAGLVFAYNIWTRVRPIGSQHRESKGEKF